ncbi:regulator of sigma E protease [Sphingomonas laterariae]|uniref:Regulator of sigma E protease n=1 Tax=Edaphosphingomonas laterariae TaxID=861865 RepID=A0A239EXJ4_9SPHN|nr:M50 family metallopeptidase [Sphingomonas laterariae]SNS49018.1 regulator of sigma E protease [Sphingomonas laterariae]
MIESPGILLTVVAFLLVIGPLIFIHELGHYYAGRLFGVKAEAFSIGFGRELIGWTDKRGTRWRIAALPLGGYVRFAGDMNPASAHVPTPEWLALPPEERNKTFQSKPLWQRFIIVAAGPLTNFLFAILVFMAVFAVNGQARTPAVLASVEPGTAAAAAGLMPGDRVTAISGQTIDRFEDIPRIVSIRPDEVVQLDIVRDGEPRSLSARIGAEVEGDRFGNEFRVGRLGVRPGQPVWVDVPFWQLPGAAIGQTADVVRMMVDTLGQIITGRRSVKELGGPLKIAQISGQQATLGWFDFVLFMTMISINLGFINLLPIPLLDGGHLLFYTVEGVVRRPLNPAVQEWAFRTGLAILLAFMVFVTANDLASFGVWQRLAGLIG